MERVEGMMQGLKLSEAERKGVRIGWRGGGKVGVVEAQAIGKLMAEKPAIADAMENALGPLWCPMRGIDCKDLGDNIFLFTFHQALGKKKAVEGGPWKFDNALLVMEDYVPSKGIDEYEFNKIPIWIRVFKLPLGMMSRETGEDIGDQIGEWIEVDGVENGLAQGKYLRVKVRMSITKPLMRGVTVVVDESGRTKWCPLEYEYLPDFCYICGMIGHLDRECDIKLKKGEEPQYGKWMRWVPPKYKSFSETKRGWTVNENNNRQGSWAGGGRRHGSDASSWRKVDTAPRGSGGNAVSKDKEGTSQLCNNEKDGKMLVAKQLMLVSVANGKEVGRDGDDVCEEERQIKENVRLLEDSTMQNRQNGGKEEEKEGPRGIEKGKEKQMEGKPTIATFKRQKRGPKQGTKGEEVTVGKKRSGDAMEVDVEVSVKTKKVKENGTGMQQDGGELNNEKAGLSEQLRKQK
ncbi:hypothetical protein QYE76_024223 [Lolium multiflorum]|uniref:CCHC-type domain-containing protein n=1 Tax=Lolium multiflorum TaxID=4521 RepID=A0AAD8RDA1_LOLMU|nr:hypothetical protein QYE76_024223 [Lolium multiflorum]